MRRVRKMTVIVELNIIPFDVGVSISNLLAVALTELEKLGVRYETTPMCTIFEAESINEAFGIVEAAHEVLFKKGVKRVGTSVRIDDRRDVSRGMKEKVESLKKAIKK